jgi:hypothetical protein
VCFAAAAAAGGGKLAMGALPVPGLQYAAGRATLLSQLNRFCCLVCFAAAAAAGCKLVMGAVAYSICALEMCSIVCTAENVCVTVPAAAGGGKLVMGALPAPGLQYAAGEDSDDPDAADGADAAAVKAPDMGQVILVRISGVYFMLL